MDQLHVLKFITQADAILSDYAERRCRFGQLHYHFRFVKKLAPLSTAAKSALPFSVRKTSVRVG